MLADHFPAGAVAAAILLNPGFQGATRLDETDEAIPEVAAPFSRALSFKMFEGDIQALALRQEYLGGSTALNVPVSFSVTHSDHLTGIAPAELVHELRRISGLTWAQIAEVFEVSERALYHWASGKTVSAENHERLVQVSTVLRFIDRGSAEDNRNFLLGSAVLGKTYLRLLRNGEYDRVRDLAGKGAGRPHFESALTQDASKFNASRHWGNAAETASGTDEIEILPLNQAKLRRAKARRNKA